MSNNMSKDKYDNMYVPATDRTPNGYTMMENWLNNIAPKYFDMKDLNVNRSGLFGYNNEVMAHAMESLMNENAVMVNEQFFRRAKLPSTIYANASHYNVSSSTAIPCRMEFALMFNEKNVISSAVTRNNETYFMIDDDSMIVVEDTIYFSLDYDIKIAIKRDINGEYVFSARYVPNGVSNPISPISVSNNPYIRTAKVKQGTETYVAIYITCNQANKIMRNKMIYSDEIIKYYTFDVGYDKSLGQIAGFNAFYREPGRTEFIQLETRSADSFESVNPFCFYQFKDTNTITISFSSSTRYFRPAVNSEIKIELYNTDGAYSAFSYTGNNVRLKLSSDLYEYRDVIGLVSSLSDSYGGENSSDFDEIKNQTAIMASTVDVISTEGDLNNLFSTIDGTSDIKFIKKRDDYGDRMYAGYILMDDDSGDIIPTNTNTVNILDSEFDTIDVQTKRYVLHAGSKFAYRPDTKILVPIKNPKDPEFLFTNPFTMVLNKSPLYMSYYCTSINKIFSPEFVEMHDGAITNFIVNKITVERNALKSDKYLFRFNCVPNTDDLKIKFANFDEDRNFVSSNHNLIAKGVVYNTGGEVAYYFNVDMTDYSMDLDVASFEGVFETDDFITSDDFIRITNGLHDITDDSNLEPLIAGGDLRVGFILYLKDSVVGSDRVSKYDDLVPGTQSYSVINVYDIDTGVDLINNMNDIMKSDILISRVGMTHTYEYSCLEVPMIGSSFMEHEKSGTNFYMKFMNNIDVMRRYLDKLTNSFGLSVKLYNTYGKSDYLYVYGTPDYKLDKVNISISLTVHLNPDKVNDNVTRLSVSNFILHYVENLNTDDNSNFYVSNLLQKLENSFDDVRWVQFYKINGYGAEVQSIEKISSSDAVGDFVPEYLTINKNYTDGKTRYDININFV